MNTSYALKLGCALSIVTATACTNDTLDADCTPDSPDITLDEDCPFQQSQGPQLPTPKCEYQQEGPSQVVVWVDVFSIFTDANSGACSLGGCHGVEETAANGIFLPAEEPVTFYNNLLATTGSVGRPYVNNKVPEDSWIHCNVAGTPGGGLIMPKPAGMPSKSDALKVEDWIFNNAPGP